ncbi:MAG TPA: GNAT family N-acetyltransferase [Clostridiaceae bacterium]|nr:GNAT family N-acetyltransferase [Clostridiaceae bacterium]
MVENLVIRKLEKGEEFPYDLLLLADPSMEAIEDYIHRGDCYIALLDNKVVGEYVLIKTRPFTIELVNIAVDEKYQGKGIGKALVMDAINRARESKAKVIEVGTGNCSAYQHLLYQKCGFRMTWIDIDFFKKHYDEEIYENGVRCIDMIRMSMDL